ncbi:1-deoxy-D-xylulose 5-phosphate reductoisomerase [uncultured Desulfobacterium sp.]|uniref:1-deoxy-D-xylulose 5-phosphate reductoisomerase n=1 Tax=uncultured Desulfobacterium sp. TaxID=201089 RepID=A0A445N219_9BACT|nr:1-deoxy-D-xylulose 5-phosphate reductoisomerase [uncultured Desulfobacterium sp.]
MKNIAVLGSTGSIGVNALKVIRANPEKYSCIALAAGSNIELLARQIAEFHPAAVSVFDEELARGLKNILSDGAIPDLFFGTEGLINVSTLSEVDTVISAITGASGLLPTYEAIKAGKEIALANKETMVAAGGIIMAEAKKNGVKVLPVDSEHSAILQSLQGHHAEDVRRVVLTASGGPFRDLNLEEMENVTALDALNHPNWNMGKKVTIDSATLMNKGLEAIEAKWFFNLDMGRISILIHPQSIVHSMVEYKDGSIIAQLAVPDMMIPISYALSYPRHLKNTLPPLELDKVGGLTFKKPDLKRFRCLGLALEAAEIGGTMPAVLNGANEIAVEAFLSGKIRFLDIPVLIEKTMEVHHFHQSDSIETVLEADRWARKKASEVLSKWI